MLHDVNHILVHHPALPDNLDPVEDVVAHPVSLLLRQRSRGLQQARLDPQLADIHQHAADRQRAQIVPGQAQLAAQCDRPDTRAEGVLVGVLVVLLEPSQPDTRVRIAAHALDHGLDRFFQADDIERATLADALEYGADIIHEGIQYQPGLGAFVFPRTGGGVGFKGAPRENILYWNGSADGAHPLEQGVVLVAALGKIDEDVAAIVAHTVYLFRTFQAEALHHERCFQPRPIQAADKHAYFQISRGNFQGMQHFSP